MWSYFFKCIDLHVLALCFIWHFSSQLHALLISFSNTSQTSNFIFEKFTPSLFTFFPCHSWVNQMAQTLWESTILLRIAYSCPLLLPLTQLLIHSGSCFVIPAFPDQLLLFMLKGFVNPDAHCTLWATLIYVLAHNWQTGNHFWNMTSICHLDSFSVYHMYSDA